MVLKDEHQETKGHEYEFHVKYNTCCPSDRYLSVDFIVKGSDDRFKCRYRSHTHVSSDMEYLSMHGVDILNLSHIYQLRVATGK